MGSAHHLVRASTSSLLMACALACCAALPSCGGRSSDGASAGNAASGAGGSTTSPGIGGDSAVSGSMGGGCPSPPPGAPATNPDIPPPAVGCYFYTNGVWHPTPCDCDLSLSNPIGASVAVAFSFTFSPANAVPSLTDLPDVEVTFEDADASWYKVWARQPQSLTHPIFSVTKADGKTTVRLASNTVTLDPVSLPGCARSVPKGSIHAAWGTALALDMQATLTDASGNLVANDTGTCSQPESHP
jgi:hypothetical protein